MRNIVLSIIFLFIISSCSFSKYYFENSEMKTGLDFTNGKWILNTIEAPYKVKNKLSELAFKDFSAKLNHRISHSRNVKEFMITPKINLKENKSELEKVYKTTGYNFFIDIKAQIVDEKLGLIDFSPSKFKKDEQNRVKVVFNIYNLKSQTVIYSKTAIGLVGTNKTNNVNFSASADMLIIGAYKKIMKDINNKSIK